MNKPARILAPILVLLACLTGCGGGDEAPPAPNAPAPNPPVPPPPPPPGTLIGAAGGTVTGPSGTKVVVPAGALNADVRILIEQTAVGAPALPGSFTVAGQTFAITPHGTVFTQPVTVTLPFDPALVPAGRTPELYKTNAQNQWERVSNAVFGASTVTATTTSFSYWATILPQLVAGRPVYQWRVYELRGEALAEHLFVTGISIEEDMANHYDFGGAFRDADVLDADGNVIAASDGRATVQVAGTDNGNDWWIGTEAPNGNAALPDSTIGTVIAFNQTQSYIKRDPDATLSFFITNAFMETSDLNGVLGRTCPSVHQIGLLCDAISAQVFLEVEAFTVPAAPFDSFDYFYTLGGSAELTGIAGSWDSRAHTAAFSQEKLWDIQDFTFTIDEINGAPEALITMKLAHPIFHEYNVDLSHVAVGQAFTLQFGATSTAYNRAAVGINGVGAEFATSARSYLRDPQGAQGITLNAAGLEAIATTQPVALPPVTPAIPVACPAPNPAAGALQFDAANYRQSEGNIAPTVTVTRTGGTAGAVTATFATSNGSAIAGTDYNPLATTVRFAAGDDTPRVVSVTAIANTTANEADKTVNLTLSQPGGCATLGAQSTALLTIQDDDPPPPPPSFTVGGTITGLEGDGLELDDLQFLPIQPTANGPFTMRFPTQIGRPYEVRITAQPGNPVQICTVINGSGIMGNANVTNVQVNCVTTPASGSLDASFGGTGKVSATFGGDETGMALQSDGKVIIVGGAGDFFVARYNSNGTLDDSFGNAGLATTDIAGGFDRAHAVALQADGKIVVAGYARVGSNDDFAVVRYLANGAPDPDFGTLGKVTTDFFGTRNRAYAVAIAGNGQVLVAGETVLPAGSGDFALVRYSTGGVLDTTFGGPALGKVTTDITGGVDNGRNIAIESGGTILVTGTITLAGDVVLENLGAARYTANGVLDNSLDVDGKLVIAGRSLGDGLALQPDGKLLVAGSMPVGGVRQFAVMRLLVNGAQDPSFGTAGLATVGFSTNSDFGRSVALQADGKVLVSGQASNGSNPDFALARFSANGVLDTSFDGDGKFTVDFFGSGDGAENIAVQTDGKIVLGGFAANGFAVRFALARVAP
jgi:uncharacterized delta-60 repeat protein